MKKIIPFSISVLLAILTGSCLSQKEIPSAFRSSYSINAGINKGGITENTDMTIVPGAYPPPEAIVDAFTGATGIGVNLGLHTTRTAGRLIFETGLDYMYNNQSFNYIDAGNFYIGTRYLDVSQFMIPLTWNIPVFGNSGAFSRVFIKIGYVAQFNLVSVSSLGILPDYSLNSFSNGASLGFSCYPFRFKNSNQLGLFLEGYRGTQVYEDYYNQPEYEMPGSSYVKFGFSFKFK